MQQPFAQASQPAMHQRPAAGSATSVEVYGFAVWIASHVGLAFYVGWAFLPTSYLHAIGITYYPDRQWAVIIPAWVLCSLIFVVWTYECLNQMSVCPLEARATIKDATFKSHKDVGWQTVVGGGRGAASTPPLMHIHPAVVSRVLFAGMAVDDALAQDDLWRMASE
mmetsp:Transcript_13821/g.40076  ORF Transcript_13821/g.40076 Transcript_13821/m.40076 type:complete len:166 (-) Transcript_13821:632-1129(-)